MKIKTHTTCMHVDFGGLVFGKGDYVHAIIRIWVLSNLQKLTGILGKKIMWKYMHACSLHVHVWLEMALHESRSIESIIWWFIWWKSSKILYIKYALVLRLYFLLLKSRSPLYIFSSSAFLLKIWISVSHFL